METSMFVPFAGMIILFLVYRNIPDKISYEKFLFILMIVSSLLIIMTPFVFVSNLKARKNFTPKADITNPIKENQNLEPDIFEDSAEEDSESQDFSGTSDSDSDSEPSTKNRNLKNNHDKSKKNQSGDPPKDFFKHDFDPLSNLSRLKDFSTRSLSSIFRRLPFKISGDKFYLELISQAKIILNYFLYEDLVLYIMFNTILKKYRSGLNSIRHFMKLALSIFLMNSIIPLFYYLFNKISLRVLIFAPFMVIGALQLASVLIMYYGIDFYTIRFYIFMKQKVIEFKVEDQKPA